MEEERGAREGEGKNKVVERTAFEGNAMKIFKHDRGEKKARRGEGSPTVAARKLRGGTRHRRSLGAIKGVCISHDGVRAATRGR